MVEDLKLERAHLGVKVDAVQEAHEEDLRVALATVARLGPFRRLAGLDDDAVRQHVALVLVQARVDLRRLSGLDRRDGAPCRS